jgi:nitrogen fixation/metabolism regulation signal transduction histidine kinase
MRSLRVRLILGFALIALLPLAIAMFFLARRIQTTVSAQASERLAATLEVLRSQIEGDAVRTRERLELLARDPALKRLYLVRADTGTELAELLAEKRVLLGLDFLHIVDPAGVVAADAATAPSALIGADREPPRLGTTEHPASGGLALLDVEGGGALAWAAAAPIRYENQVVGRLRGGVLLDTLVLQRLRGISGIELILTDAQGRIVAGTLAGGVATLPMPGADRARLQASDGRAYQARRLALGAGADSAAGITGLASTAAADQTVAALRTTSLLLGLVGLAIAIALGVLWSLQVSRPVERLARFSERIAEGDWEEPLALESVREIETLALALDRMRRDLRGYRARLLTSERHAAWSQMARQVAHEVKNPLTPIAVSVADLKRSYEQKREDFPVILDQAVRTIGEEVQSLKHLLQEFSELGRFPEPRFAPCGVVELLSRLETLYGGDVSAGRLAFSPAPSGVRVRADAGQLQQALVNLVQNGLEAVDGKGRVEVGAREVDESVEITVSDDGAGLDAEQRARLFVPEFTTKARGSGLGLSIVERIVNDHGGAITVTSEPGRGTTFRIRLPRLPEA